MHSHSTSSMMESLQSINQYGWLEAKSIHHNKGQAGSWWTQSLLSWGHYLLQSLLMLMLFRHQAKSTTAWHSKWICRHATHQSLRDLHKASMQPYHFRVLDCGSWIMIASTRRSMTVGILLPERSSLQVSSMTGPARPAILELMECTSRPLLQLELLLYWHLLHTARLFSCHLYVPILLHKTYAPQMFPEMQQLYKYE